MSEGRRAFRRYFGYFTILFGMRNTGFSTKKLNLRGKIIFKVTEFERDLVDAFNSFFDENGINAIAYRRKQHRFSSQFVDILVDSLNPSYYLAIENKSISVASGTSCLYFSQHFSENQISRIDNFLEKSGRSGFLSVELKMGKGNKRRAYMIPWDQVKKKVENDEVGFELNEIKSFVKLKRDGGGYRIPYKFI
ncbi:MAG: Vsr-like endonucleases PD-DExK superfamily [Candidatus Methanohalarchaeum thermophilum]|uniref:Vsr-like endonucleases PD-DExK superfamily n=1 Tax=Methanohalarchaeum thermophilum TaxID=1903181 RepID=A0A1Q6DVW5_METT1|nr:MAG: Vsr-like endonucleases PD-DExK superfamily [Candidatus Methanohalarchaeum thermophilum]